MVSFWQDLRHGPRILAKNPGFTAIAVTTLRLGIGANSATFSVTDKLLIRSLAVKDPQQLDQLYQRQPALRQQCFLLPRIQ